MYVVTVTLPGTFPFTEIEAHANATLANERATEWLEFGGATHAAVTHVVDWATRTVTTVGMLAGLGKALGLATFDFTGADGEGTELVAA